MPSSKTYATLLKEFADKERTEPKYEYSPVVRGYNCTVNMVYKTESLTCMSIGASKKAAMQNACREMLAIVENMTQVSLDDQGENNGNPGISANGSLSTNIAAANNTEEGRGDADLNSPNLNLRDSTMDTGSSPPTAVTSSLSPTPVVTSSSSSSTRDRFPSPAKRFKGDETKIGPPLNAVGALNEYLAKKRRAVAQFTEVENVIIGFGASKKPRYTMRCIVDRIQEDGTAYSKKEAKALSAEKVLKILKENDVRSENNVSSSSADSITSNKPLDLSMKNVIVGSAVDSPVPCSSTGSPTNAVVLEKNYRQVLYERMKGKGSKLEYEVTVHGVPSKLIFTTTVTADSRSATGEGLTKREAKENACKNYLEGNSAPLTSTGLVDSSPMDDSGAPAPTEELNNSNTPDQDALPSFKIQEPSHSQIHVLCCLAKNLNQEVTFDNISPPGITKTFRCRVGEHETVGIAGKTNCAKEEAASKILVLINNKYTEFPKFGVRNEDDDSETLSSLQGETTLEKLKSANNWLAVVRKSGIQSTAGKLCEEFGVTVHSYFLENGAPHSFILKVVETPETTRSFIGHGDTADAAQDEAYLSAIAFYVTG